MSEKKNSRFCYALDVISAYQNRDQLCIDSDGVLDDDCRQCMHAADISQDHMRQRTIPSVRMSRHHTIIAAKLANPRCAMRDESTSWSKGGGGCNYCSILK
jgi:hypothetical protein